MLIMGARSPINQRPRRGGLKCDFCSRSFPSALSLHRHQNSLHASALKAKERRALPKKAGLQKGVNSKGVVKPKLKLVKAKPKVLQAKKPILKETPAKQTEVVVNTVKEETKARRLGTKAKMDLKPSTTVRKVEFKCPVCIRIFPVYFSAKKHIQKHHSNNKTLSSKSIEPIRTEICIFCNKMVTDGIEDHNCDLSHDLTGLSLTYICTGCNQKFQSMRLFDMHISGVHSEGVESMFFPTIDEFNEWKTAMEGQTKSSYLIMGKYQYKQIYRCSKTTVNENDEKSPAYFCPSTLTFQQFSKGIQVHFYKEHHGHPFSKYILPDKYKKYSLTDMLHQATGYEYPDIGNAKYEQNDLYCQFKKLMDSIVLDAAKVNIETLQTLVGKALEMISVLKDYKTDYDDESTTLSSSNNRDHELAKALDALNNVSKATKRSINTIEVVPVKRLNKSESLDKSPILQKATKAKPTAGKFSLADDRDDQKILKELGGPNVNKVSSPIPTPVKKSVESPSFNDTYKNFVEKNLKTPNLKTPATARNSGPASAKKKDVVKTKMGQFKPGNSPKKPIQNGAVPTGKTSKPSTGKPSDVEYEVKEQENDCNILILKI